MICLALTQVASPAAKTPGTFVRPFSSMRISPPLVQRHEILEEPRLRGKPDREEEPLHVKVLSSPGLTVANGDPGQGRTPVERRTS